MKLTEQKLKNLIREAATEYIWGVKGLHSRLGNQYKLHTIAEGANHDHGDRSWSINDPLSEEQVIEVSKASLPGNTEFKDIIEGARKKIKKYVDLLATPAFQKDVRTKEFGY